MRYVRVLKSPLTILEGPRELPRSFANITGFHNLSDQELAKYGWHPFEEGGDSVIETVERPVTRRIRLDEGKVKIDTATTLGTEQEKIAAVAELRRQALSRLSERRWSAETAGVLVDGTLYPTTREARSTLSLYSSTGSDVRWKAGSRKWISLSPDDAQRVASAIGEHVAACFKNEERLEGVIIEADTVADIEAIDLDQGWPE